jgi:hypothetical protein
LMPQPPSVNPSASSRSYRGLPRSCRTSNSMTLRPAALRSPSTPASLHRMRPKAGGESGSLRTPRWREVDSNSRSRSPKARIPDRVFGLSAAGCESVFRRRRRGDVRARARWHVPAGHHTPEAFCACRLRIGFRT